MTNLPIIAMAHVAFAIVMTTRLLLLDADADWDSTLARHSLDFADVAARVANKCEEADRVAAREGKRRRMLDDGSAALQKYSFKIRWIRQWYLSKLPQAQVEIPEGPEPVATTPARSETAFGGDGGVTWGDIQLDEGFWQNILALDGIYPQLYEDMAIDVPGLQDPAGASSL